MKLLDMNFFRGLSEYEKTVSNYRYMVNKNFNELIFLVDFEYK